MPALPRCAYRATCNLKRPKDGSDYTGPVTLWATAPGVIVLAAKPVPKQRQSWGLCHCGQEISRGYGHPTRCHDCLVQLGQDAALLRAAGMKWREIGAVLGYANTGGLYTYARRYGQQQQTVSNHMTTIL